MTLHLTQRQEFIHPATSIDVFRFRTSAHIVSECQVGLTTLGTGNAFTTREEGLWPLLGRAPQQRFLRHLSSRHASPFFCLSPHSITIGTARVMVFRCVDLTVPASVHYKSHGCITRNLRAPLTVVPLLLHSPLSTRHLPLSRRLLTEHYNRDDLRDHEQGSRCWVGRRIPEPNCDNCHRIVGNYAFVVSMAPSLQAFRYTLSSVFSIYCFLTCKPRVYVL